MKAKTRTPRKPGNRTQPKSKPEAPPALLKGWQQIAGFLSQSTSVAQRWAKEGMPVTRQGRYATATPEDLNNWLGREAGGEPIKVATATTDLSAELKRGLAFARQQKKRSDRD
jgi:hypothetical protein